MLCTERGVAGGGRKRRFAFCGRIKSLSAYVFERVGGQMEEVVRRSIKASREADRTLRAYLGARGMKKGDLSKFIEQAVRWRILSCTVRDIKARNANADVNELQATVDAAVREVHAELRSMNERPKKKRART